MKRFEILCVTMNQKDFSKIDSMNIHSDVVFANQAGFMGYEELEFEGRTAKLVSTNTVGVGINRNISLMYSDSEICLFSDDDVRLVSDAEEIILREFQKYRDADIIIFNITADDPSRQDRIEKRTRKCGKFSRVSSGCCRVAFRSSSVKKANVWFTPLLGGGAMYPFGEDSLWLNEARRKGLTIYFSKENIGTVYFEKSTWFTGTDEKYLFGRGAYYKALHRHSFWIWCLYAAFQLRKIRSFSLVEKLRWMYAGKRGFEEFLPYNDFCEKYGMHVKKDKTVNK